MNFSEFLNENNQFSEIFDIEKIFKGNLNFIRRNLSEKKIIIVLVLKIFSKKNLI